MPVDLARLSRWAQDDIARKLGGKPKGRRYKRPRIDMAPLWVQAWDAYCSERFKQMPPWIPEYRFDNTRRWRFDWARPFNRIAVEVDGGRWMPGGGRHGSDADREKMNAAAADGWRVFRFSPTQLTSDPRGCVAEVERALLSEGR